MRARERVSRCVESAKKVNVIKMNSSLLLLLLFRAAPRPVNARSVPRTRLKAISSTLFCCPQSTAASATLRFNFLSLSLSLTLRDCGVLGAGGAGFGVGDSLRSPRASSYARQL